MAGIARLVSRLWRHVTVLGAGGLPFAVDTVVRLAAWIARAAWLVSPGSDGRTGVEGRAVSSAVPALAAADPSLRGRHEIRTLTYGSGTDRRRPEYGEAVSLRTGPVDASRLVNDRAEYVPMFRDVRAAAAWLPETAYWSQFEDSTYEVVSDFRGIDLGRGTLDGSRQAGRHLTLWHAGPFKGRGDWPFQVPVLYLGWSPRAGEPASYRITLAEGTAARWRLDDTSRLALTVADAREDRERTPLDFTIEVATSDGAVGRIPLSRIRPLSPVPSVRLTNWAYLERQFFFGEAEPALQTCEIPLETFASAAWHPARIRDVRLVFDRSPAGTIVLSSVGFARP